MEARLVNEGFRVRACLLTLRGLGAYIFLDQGICRLGVKAESIFQGPQIRALLKESLLEAISSSMEILLKRKMSGLLNSES